MACAKHPLLQWLIELTLQGGNSDIDTVFSRVVKKAPRTFDVMQYLASVKAVCQKKGIPATTELLLVDKTHDMFTGDTAVGYNSMELHSRMAGAQNPLLEWLIDLAMQLATENNNNPSTVFWQVVGKAPRVFDEFQFLAAVQAVFLKKKKPTSTVMQLIYKIYNISLDLANGKKAVRELIPMGRIFSVFVEGLEGNVSCEPPVWTPFIKRGVHVPTAKLSAQEVFSSVFGSKEQVLTIMDKYKKFGTWALINQLANFPPLMRSDEIRLMAKICRDYSDIEKVLPFDEIAPRVAQMVIDLRTHDSAASREFSPQPELPTTFSRTAEYEEFISDTASTQSDTESRVTIGSGTEHCRLGSPTWNVDFSASERSRTPTPVYGEGPSKRHCSGGSAGSGGGDR